MKMHAYKRVDAYFSILCANTQMSNLLLLNEFSEVIRNNKNSLHANTVQTDSF